MIGILRLKLRRILIFFQFVLDGFFPFLYNTFIRRQGMELRQMAKMAVLVPYQNMLELTEHMFDEYPKIQKHTVEYVSNERVAERAREIETEGCDVIMARGFQARLVKHTVKLPVVEIQVTAQELGMLVLDIKEELQLENPKIAVVGSDNMICDTTHFNRLFQVDFETYQIKPGYDSEDALRTAVKEAEKNGCLAVIGGSVVCWQAEELGLVHRFIPCGRESLQSAFRIAERICYAIDLEKVNGAEMSVMLDNTQRGIMRVNAEGFVLRANANTFNLLNLPPSDLIGKNLSEILPALSSELMDKTLKNGEESYTILVPPSRRETVVNINPVMLEGKVDGAILMLQEGRRVIAMNSELRHELYLHGHMAPWHFNQYPSRSPESRKTVEQASRIAKYSAPVLLSGEAGTGKEMLAQCIHNAGLTKNNAFISLDCQAYHEDTLDTTLFGNYSVRKDTISSMVEAAQDGTLFLSNIDALSNELQYKILRLIRGTFLHNGSNKPMEADVRVIAATRSNLIAKVEDGSFRSDLYYAINALGITLKPIRERREDILPWVEIYLSQWKERYDRVVHLTQSAEEYLVNYDWPGNLNQINSVCERIVLLSDHRNIDEGFLQRQIRQLTPKLLPGTGQIVLFKDEKAVEISELLKRYNGNRQKVADELGISKTTLWRYIKKYGIEKDFSY